MTCTAQVKPVRKATRHNKRIDQLVEEGWRAYGFRAGLATAVAISKHRRGFDYTEDGELYWHGPELVGGVAIGSKSEDDFLAYLNRDGCGLYGPIRQSTMRWWRSELLGDCYYPNPDAWRVLEVDPCNPPKDLKDPELIYQCSFICEVAEVVDRHEFDALRLCQWAEVHRILWDEGCLFRLRVIDISSIQLPEQIQVFDASTFDALEFRSDQDDFINSGLSFEAWSAREQMVHEEGMRLMYWSRDPRWGSERNHACVPLPQFTDPNLQARALKYVAGTVNMAVTHYKWTIVEFEDRMGWSGVI